MPQESLRDTSFRDAAAKLQQLILITPWGDTLSIETTNASPNQRFSKALLLFTRRSDSYEPLFTLKELKLGKKRAGVFLEHVVTRIAKKLLVLEPSLHTSVLEDFESDIHTSTLTLPLLNRQLGFRYWGESRTCAVSLAQDAIVPIGLPLPYTVELLIPDLRLFTHVYDAFLRNWPSQSTKIIPMMHTQAIQIARAGQ